MNAPAADRTSLPPLLRLGLAYFIREERLGALAMRLDRFDRPIAMRNLEIACPALSRAERLGIMAGPLRRHLQATLAGEQPRTTAHLLRTLPPRLRERVLRSYEPQHRQLIETHLRARAGV